MRFMRYSISDTAEYGDYTRGPRVITEETRAEMRRILDAIQDGSFAREWLAENRAGRPNFERLRQAGPGARDRAGGQAAPGDDALVGGREGRGGARRARAEGAARCAGPRRRPSATR